ncbi:1735_t:CDS:1, partial [Acaulospora morrowiae]
MKLSKRNMHKKLARYAKKAKLGEQPNPTIEIETNPIFDISNEKD